MKYPVFEPYLSDTAKEYAKEAIDSGWISATGKYSKRFEKEFSSYFGVKHAVPCSNGTAALEIALYSAGIGKGDEVICPSFTIISVALAVLRVGAKPIFVDVDKVSWNLNSRLVKSAITPKTKGIIVVHSFGEAGDIEDLISFAREQNIILIEDIAEAIGSEINNKKLGSFGYVAAGSLYSNKLITSGEGGFILTDSKEVYLKAKAYLNLGFSVGINRFEHEILGFNYRLTNVQCALALGQLEAVERLINLNKIVSECYAKELEGLKKVRYVKRGANCGGITWMNIVLLDKFYSVEEIMAKLIKRGVDCRRLFKGLHMQKPLNLRKEDKTSLPVTEMLYDRGLYLPSSPNLSSDDVHFICNQLKELLNE